MNFAIPEPWKHRVREYLRQHHGAEREYLSANDFPHQSVIIRFPDGSLVLFRYAFALRDEVSKEVAVFTEHCGYHVFPLTDSDLEVVRAVWPVDTSTE
jgi:hypothetical protein